MGGPNGLGRPWPERRRAAAPYGGCRPLQCDEPRSVEPCPSQYRHLRQREHEDDRHCDQPKHERTGSRRRGVRRVPGPGAAGRPPASIRRVAEACSRSVAPPAPARWPSGSERSAGDGEEPTLSGGAPVLTQQSLEGDAIPPSLGFPCRFCAAPVSTVVCDLGMSPLCESFLTAEQLNQMERFYPLRADVCERCWLVQLERYVAPEEIFTEYAYFSSYSDSWVRHARDYTEMITDRLGLGAGSLAVELASNDGYLLQHFVTAGVPVLGVEPALNVAEAAVERGVPTMTRFFGEELAAELAAQGRQADLIIANNVLAQVPDLNSFVAGIKLLLKPGGVVTVEFPHLLRLMEGNQFDTIYHEHFSYFSFSTARRIFARHGITLFDVEELPTHGGSLRIYGRHATAEEPPVGERVERRLAREAAAGLETPAPYRAFGEQVIETKRKLLAFLIRAKREGAR